MEEKKKPIFKKWWFWVIIIIVVVAVAGGSGDNTTVTSGNDTGTPQQNQSTNKTANVGDVVTTDEVKISYTSCKDYTGYSSYFKPSSGNKVIKVQFEFENISNEDVYLKSFECYADGEKCETYLYGEDSKSPIAVSLSKGKKYKAVLYYEIPKAAEEVILEYETDYWSDEKVEFIVK